jgi:cyclophilin family peptidyl-prolyl cis-trans isomerase
MEDCLRRRRISPLLFFYGNPAMKKLFALAAGLLWSLTALAANPVVEMKTNQGLIVIELYADKAPKSVENFLQYVKDGFYNGTIFHRVIDGFMIQGGGFEPGMKQKPTRAPIENEAKNGLKNVVGTLAMARTPNPHSASAQFFINVANNGFLDYPGQDGWGYAVFGKVIQGLDVVQKIAKVKKGHQDIPVDLVVIESTRLLPEAKPAK